MRDENDRAGKARNDLLQQVERLDVEVVGRLVEDQQVGGLGHDPRQHQPRPFAAREVLDRRARLLRLEQEVLHIAGHMLLFAVDQQVLAAPVRQIMGERVVEVQILALLVERGDLQIGAELHRAFVGLQLAGQHLQKRRLAGAIGSDEADAVAAMDPKRERRHDGAIAVALGDLLGLDHQLAAVATLGDRRLDRALRSLVAAIVGAHLLQVAEPAHVALAPCRHAVAQPVLLALDRLAELVLLDLFFFEHLVAPFLELAETAVQPPRQPAVQPDGGVGHLFEEPTVMRDQDEGAARRRKLAFEPLDRRQVQMVGRLVEQQDIGFGRQHPGERCTPRLPARQTGRIFLTRQPQMLQQIGHAIGVVAGAEPRFGIGLHGRIAGKIRRLFEVAHGGGRMAKDFARLRLDHAGRDLHQRRFARAVAADKADPVARLDLQIGTVEQRRAAEGKLDVVEFQNGRRQGFRLRSCHGGGQGRSPRRCRVKN